MLLEDGAVRALAGRDVGVMRHCGVVGGEEDGATDDAGVVGRGFWGRCSSGLEIVIGVEGGRGWSRAVASGGMGWCSG